MRVVPLLAYLALAGLASAFAGPNQNLVELAKNRFAPHKLTNAEIELFRAAQNGTKASALIHDAQENAPEDDPKDCSTWPAERVVKAECLKWLLTDKEASALVKYNGVEMRGMRVDGNLDLSDAEIVFPVFALKCAFTGNFYFKRARIKGLYLVDCCVTVLNGNGARITDGIFLRHGSRATGEVNLLNANIGGNVDCERAELINPEGIALNADGAKIDGNVFLRKGFRSEGEINFVGATVGGGFECDGAEVTNRTGKALNADSAKIAGGVFFSDGFKAIGEVNLVLATVGRNLECDTAQFSNPGGIALNANGISINGSVFLRYGFDAAGEVNFHGATIAGRLDCEGGQFSNPTGYALMVEETKVGAGVFLRSNFKADGGVSFVSSEVKGYFAWYDVVPADGTWINFQSAKIATLRDYESSWPAQGMLFLDGFTYDRFDEDSPATAQTRIRWILRQRQTGARGKFLPQPYEQLASVLKNMGHEREARKVMIAKNRDHADFTKEFSQEWWWYNCFGWLIGYGYAPSRAFFLSVGVILFGWWRFHRGYQKKLVSPSRESAYRKDAVGNLLKINDEPQLSDEYPRFNALVFSLESFVPFLRLDQTSNWTPNAKGRFVRAYLWFHIIAGWVLTSLWVGGLTGLVKT